jgi:TetR/AcrR family transcriptional repressor of nem operon
MSTPSTKDQLLHEASRMLLKKGFQGMSLQELATNLNIKKASLFHYFPSKTAMAVELYRFYQKAFVLWTSNHQKLAPEKQIIAYADELTSWICEKQRVCPVGALSLEWHQVQPELQNEIKVLHHLQKDWLTNLLKLINKKSKLRIPLNDAVTTTMGLIQGSIQQARILDDPDLVRKNLKAHLKAIKGDGKASE